MELTDLKGIGPKGLKILNKLCINSIEDLITFYPFRYNIIKRSDINSLEDNDKIIMDGIVETTPSIFRFKSKMDKMTFKINTGSNLMNVNIYNRGFLKTKLQIGSSITLIGKYDKKHNTIVASELRFGKILHNHIEPVYHTTYGITNNNVIQFIKEALEKDIEIKDYIPNVLKEKYQFNDKLIDIKNIHNPKNIEVLKESLKRLKYEELFQFMLKMNYLKMDKNNKIGLKRSVSYDKVLDFINTLSFELTKDQLKAVEDIYNDLISPKRMNRLLQGDVGSGKTIVSIISMYINYLSGYQSALMVPTEILANQHYEEALKIFSKYKIKIELLTSSTSKTKRVKILKELDSGDIDLIIGTHSLIQDEVIFNKLGLVITDEQHRFGVSQRDSLASKSHSPDVLSMSATPIPRTYALTIYGDMDISNTKTKPVGRKEVITYFKQEKEITDVLNMIKIELDKGHQVYVIAPLIEDEDDEEEPTLKDIKTTENILRKYIPEKYTIGTLHGKMKPKEKDEIMNDFKENKINVLVSTTVIEVGVDVKNSTMMVIFNAERFGLATLHQLRGRVGRNDVQSYCYLISNYDKERLHVMEESNDGFYISEQDFKLRGGGDLFGTRQSGDMVFKIGDLRRDYKILVQCKNDAGIFLQDNIKNDFKDYPQYREIIKALEFID